MLAGRNEMKAPPLTPDRIVQLAYAFREAKVLLSAAELGVFAALAEGPAQLETLLKRIGIHKRGGRHFLDALVALGVIDRDADGRYSNTRSADLYLVEGTPTYIGGLLHHLNKREYPDWNLLTRALQTGEPPSGATTAGFYPTLYADPAYLETFVGAMSGGSLLVAKELAGKFSWQHYNTLVDIGSAEGCLPVQIAKCHAHIVGGGFDLPAVGPAFDSYVQENGLSHRLRFYPGDFLTDPLPAADVLVMGRVLHNWDLPTKRMLLKKAYDALTIGGALIVYERLIDDERRIGAAGLLASLNMLVMTAGGFDYSGAECIGWMREAGFHDMRVERLTPDQSMIVGLR
jgi:hypothetical protein